MATSSLISYFILTFSALFGLIVMLFPRESLELQAQVHKSLQWKLELKSVERETLRMQFAGVIMVIGGVVGIICVANMNLAMRYVIYH